MSLVLTLRDSTASHFALRLGPCATCRGAVVGINRGGARGPRSWGGAWGCNRRWKVRELRGARRGHINRLAEHPRHPVVSRIVLIVVMAMTDSPPNLVQARLLFTLRDGQPSIVLY